MWPDRTELTEILTSASDQVANVVIRPAEGRIRFEYADVAMVHSLFGDVHQPEGREAFERAVRLSQRLISLVRQLPTLTLREYMIRRNIDPRRIFRTEPQSPESRKS